MEKTNSCPPQERAASTSAASNESGDAILVLVFLAQSRCEPEHQLHAFHFVQPIGERGVEFFFLGGDDSGRTKRAELAESNGAIAIDRAITRSSAPFVVF